MSIVWMLGDAKDDCGPPVRAFFERVDWRSFWLTAGIAFAVYVWTAAPEVTLDVSGALATGAKCAGVPFPPGFPLWTIYSWLFTKLVPFSNIAWRITLGSALAGALACGIVALMVSRGGWMYLESMPAFSRWNAREGTAVRTVCGAVAGLALAFGNSVWGECVIVDYWALSDLLFALILCLLMRWTSDPACRRYLYAAAWLYGCLLTNSQELIVAGPGLLVHVLLVDKRLGRDLVVLTLVLLALYWLATAWRQAPELSWFTRTDTPLVICYGFAVVGGLATTYRYRRIGGKWKAAVLCAIFVALGLGWCLYPPLASMTNPPANWNYARTAEGFLHLLSRGQFEKPHPTSQWIPYFRQAKWLVIDTSRSFGWVYFLFILLPFRVFPNAGWKGRIWMLGLVAVFAGVGPTLLAMLNPFVEQASGLATMYFSAMYVILAIWTGLGLIVVAGCFCNRRPTPAPLSERLAGDEPNVQHSETQSPGMEDSLSSNRASAAGNL